MLKLTNDLFEQASEKELPLSRVHLHPYGSFLMCYDNSKWHSAQEAIIKSSIAVPKYCQMGSREAKDYDWLRNPADYEIPDLPREIKLPNGS